MPALSVELMVAWAFTHSSFVAWDKQVIGLGYRFRSQCELLLIGTRGRGLPIPAPADRVPNLISDRRGWRVSNVWARTFATSPFTAAITSTFQKAMTR
jgi:hypothetical protein